MDGRVWAGRLLIRNHLAQCVDVLLDVCDFFGPGARALVRDAGCVLAFGFGERIDCVSESLV